MHVMDAYTERPTERTGTGNKKDNRYESKEPKFRKVAWDSQVIHIEKTKTRSEIKEREKVGRERDTTTEHRLRGAGGGG
jgi:hypothetical protein